MNIWPYITFILIAALLLPFIEWCRYKNEYGKKPNLDKRVTTAIAVVCFLLLCWAFRLFQWPVIFFALSCLGIRGVFYDPALNLFFGRYIDEISTTTNSWIDHREQQMKISFWMQRFLYAGVAVVFGILYELIKKA